MTPRTQGNPRPLLNGELWPLTGQLAFIDAVAADVAEVLAAWRVELGREPAVSAVTGSLRDLLGSLQPLGFGYRELVLPTTSRWTSYWSNDFNGPDPAPLSYLAERMACRALFLMWSPAPGQEAIRFELYADHPTAFLNIERTIQVGRNDDGRWQFDASGDVQPFEDLAAYRSRRLVDRLTPAMIAGYARALGAQPFDVDFYGHAGWLVTTRDPRPDVRVTIAELQARYGYKPGVE
jgi:hypothetical protein